MRVVTKILLSIAIFCGGSLLVSLIVQGMGNKVSSGGIGPFIIYPAKSLELLRYGSITLTKKKIIIN